MKKKRKEEERKRGSEGFYISRRGGLRTWRARAAVATVPNFSDVNDDDTETSPDDSEGQSKDRVID